ncbi:hypothetical protein JK358_29390 [Nocardia sp. 2]|uniref:Uncharacterized protein n=1 Tax=Nocardia acididurans TaxID=2802282 RepID=A0ABS1MD33_9NOCA|nr:hypothetical protein [Nocardia acididurans]MBL1078527.1 hypothetical protein [Nocardia acididurans]
MAEYMPAPLIRSLPDFWATASERPAVIADTTATLLAPAPAASTSGFVRIPRPSPPTDSGRPHRDAATGVTFRAAHPATGPRHRRSGRTLWGVEGDRS